MHYNRSLYGVDMTRDVNLDGFTTTGNIRDGLVSALKVMEYEHHEIHEGKFYVGSLVSTALTSGATLSLAANPIPVGTYAHFRFGVHAGGAALVQLLEDSTLSSGTATSLVNMNRNVSSAPFQALANPDIDGGKVLVEYTMGSEGGRQAGPGGGRGSLGDEFITKDNETYIITVRNESSVPYPASINVGFYYTTVGTTGTT